MANSVGKFSSAKEERKLRKPLIERKRRERINNCLDQLKETVVGAFRLDQSKLEKADILEMTVKHLQNIQHNKTMADSTLGLEAQQRYSTGYIQCMHEVHNLLLTCEWMDKTLGARLLNHLLKSLPGSSEETCKASPKPSAPVVQSPQTRSTPVSRGVIVPTPSPSPEHFHPFDEKLPLSDLAPLPSSSVSTPQQPVISPPRQIQQENLLNNPGMASLDMWRPW
nr:PREDICTED: transcription cofactor HES-6-like [Latimeria chalumnae]|eukprot:XP_006012251.1 PREDICTED: transcription cofactor HES-6-like [Latimeria chalumnae]